MKICKIFEWDASHQLSLPYESKCNTRHGHRYKIEIELEGKLNKNGMVMDFSKIKEIINHCSFDHKDINENIAYFKTNNKNPTAEHLVEWLHWQLSLMWKETDPKISRIRVWEIPTSYAEENY